MARHRKLTQKFAGFPMFKLATGGDTYPLTSPFTSDFVGLDGLALDLQFATDKTLTARKGPTPVFTRGSNATFVGSDRLVRYAPNNSALYSGAIVSGTGWLTSQTTSVVDDIGPDGNNAYTITEDTTTNVHGASNTGGLTGTTAMSVASGITYTGSIFLKKITGGVDWVQLTFGGGGFGSAQYANFNISTGVVGNFAGSTATIEAFPNGWYRCRISVIAITTTTTTGGLGMFFTNNTNSTTRAPSYTGNASNKFLAAMCQFEIGSTISAYNRTTTAAFYGPRFDHDPVTGVCKGLLIEESRTNASWYSGALVVGTGWSANATPSVTSVVDGLGPDGNNAYEITEIANTGTHTLFNTGGSGTTGATSVVSGTTYTGSIFVKKAAGSVDWIQLSFSSTGFGSVQYANFNLSNGTIGNFSSSSPKIQDAGNGWYRCSITVVATTTTTTTSNLFLAFTNNTDTTTRLPSYAGNTANKILAAMVQFEAGSFATSYIPTTTASVVRSADVCSITGSDFSGFYNPLEGSLFTSAIFNAPVTYAPSQGICDINDTTTANRLRMIRSNTTGFGSFSNTSNSTQNVTLSTTVASQPLVTQKYSSGFKLDDYAFCVNNVQIGTDNLGAMPISVTTLTIGDASAGFTPRLYLNGTISALRYFRKRLPNAKLQAITV